MKSHKTGDRSTFMETVMEVTVVLGIFAHCPAAAKSLQSCPTLCDPIDGSPPGSPVPGILQARTLEWVAFPSPVRESEAAQSCPTLSDPRDCSPPGSSVHGFSRQECWSGVPSPSPAHCPRSRILSRASLMATSQVGFPRKQMLGQSEV